MQGKNPWIETEKVYSLLERVKEMIPEHRGIDRHAYLFDEYAVLSTSRLKLRNVDVRDNDLYYLNDIIERLAKLKKVGVNVVPILGYCYDPESPDGEGFLIMQRAKGTELYDDAIICQYQVWTQNKDDVYLKSDADAAEYIVTRTHTVAQIPQAHFDKFVSDIITILKSDILIDFQGKSNFFYDEKEGFQFIDLDSHTDNYYGLTDESASVEERAAIGSLVPCHFGTGTEIFAPLALDPKAIQGIEEKRLDRLASDNLCIFDKCIRAMKTNGISKEVLCGVLQKLKVFGR